METSLTFPLTVQYHRADHIVEKGFDFTHLAFFHDHLLELCELLFLFRFIDLSTFSTTFESFDSTQVQTYYT